MQVFFDRIVIMSQQQQLLFSVCFQTEHAISRKEEEAEFRFKAALDRPNIKPSKVMLGSMEFPIVQYSVEKEWSRLYYCERISISEDSRVLTIKESVANESKVWPIVLPMHLNKIEKMTLTSDGTIMQCEQPHGLWTGGVSLIQFYNESWNADAYIIGLSGGTKAIVTEGIELSYVDEMAFVMKGLYLNEESCVLHVPGFQAPFYLCEAINFALAKLPTRLNYSFKFDSNKCLANLSVIGNISQETSVTVDGDFLALRLGYKNKGKRFVNTSKYSSGVVTQNMMNQIPSVLQIQEDLEEANTIKPDLFEGWDYIEFDEGWYVPAHRPMATGQPLRINQEFDQQFNRFTLVQPKDKSHANCIIYTDDIGTTYMSQLMSGVYNAISLANHIETVMNSAGSRGLAYSFKFDPCLEKFVISCKRGDTPVEFSVLFAHPMSVAPEKIGFDVAEYCGSHVYYSDPVHVAHLEWPRVNWCIGNDSNVRFHTNNVQMGEAGAQKRLKIQTAPPVMLAGIVINEESSQKLTLKIVNGTFPYSHGLQPGRIIYLYPISNDLEVNTQDGAIKLTPFAFPEETSTKLMAIVLESSSNSPNVLEVFTSDVRWTSMRTMGIGIPPEPLNFCFADGFAKNIGGRRLGFKKNVVQWGRDGSILAGNLKVMPFISPCVHCMDHPDYILMYLNEGKRGTTLQHGSNSGISIPFAKIILYPLFREERMVPKETTMISGESLSTFSISFRNPDNSPYHFHGAEFSFTLNFFT